MIRNVADALLAFALSFVFFIAAVPKLRHPRGFLLAVLEYRILPESAAHLYAWLVPPLELLSAVLVLSGATVRFGAVVMALLLASFIPAISINLLRGRDLDCHCFGSAARRHIGWGLVAQDAVLLAASIALMALASGWTIAEPWSVFGLGVRALAPAFPALAHVSNATLFLATVVVCGVLTLCCVFLLRGPWKAGPRPRLMPRRQVTATSDASLLQEQTTQAQTR